MTMPCERNSHLFLAMPEMVGDRHERQYVYAKAKAVCAGCPILAECRADVLATEAAGLPVYGVAGGLAPHERPNGVRHHIEPASEQPRRQGPQRRHGRPPKPKAAEEQPAKPMGRPPKPCGTEAARTRHRRRGERCLTCFPALRWVDIPKVDKAPRRDVERRRAELLAATEPRRRTS